LTPAFTNTPIPTNTPTKIPTSTPQNTPSNTPTATQAPQNDCKPLDVKGSPDKKIDVVILPEGYTDLNDFMNDAKTVIFETKKTNLGVLWNKVNFWLLTDITVKFDHYFNCGGIARAICWDSDKALKEQKRCPGGDTYLILVNNYTYGGSAYRGIGAAISKSALWAGTHEFSHSIASLDDEYILDDNPSAPEGKMPGANCSNESSNRFNTPCPKWEQYLSAGVGCYPGCSYVDWFRPTMSSMMEDARVRYLNPPSLEGWKNALINYE
jgi:hypothetical protein